MDRKIKFESVILITTLMILLAGCTDYGAQVTDGDDEKTYNGKKITMQEYEDYMNSYEFIDPDSEGARPAP